MRQNVKIFLACVLRNIKILALPRLNKDESQVELTKIRNVLLACGIIIPPCYLSRRFNSTHYIAQPGIKKSRVELSLV